MKYVAPSESILYCLILLCSLASFILLIDMLI